MKKIKELDTVALLKNIPKKNLSKGQVGTVVEKLDSNTFEIEFSNAKGETILTIPVKKRDLILLRFEPVSA
ncbi:protein of unknown function [Fodinibius roseus]|uniref:DUF4926 domain-containing protein n=1 Tax=Fodinibius roseus TaxID=1194090 RepID=A0A1M4T4G9_9BACT|nr:DUF4926 domain-containing protein [Fodinibius roseus]SHE39320.1 protein of unknown function [Fodinibius roseus]